MRDSRPWLFWTVLLGVLARLYHIDSPPHDHHWYRQYENAAIARNFYEGDMNPLHPRIDWGGDTPGYVESEFPAYTYTLAALYHLLGPREWVGRALTIAFYVVTCIVFHRFARRFLDEPFAVLAVAFYSFLPLSYFFTRTIQGEALVALCTLVGLHSFWAWTEDGGARGFAAAAVGTGLAIPIKPTNLYLGLPMVYLLHRRFGWSFLRRPGPWLFGAVVLLPAALWYRHSYGLWEQYGNTLFRAYAEMGLPGPTDRLWLALGKNLLLRLVFAIATPPGLILLLVGFFTRPPRGNWVLYWWTAAFGVSVLLAPDPHMGHDYYQLPITFVTSTFMAQGASILAAGSRLGLRRAAVGGLCVLMLAASVGTVRGYFLNDPWRRQRVAFGTRVAALTDPSARVIFLCERPYRPGWFQHRLAPGEYGYHDCVDFYLSHRKGWSLGADQATPERIDQLRRRGAQYLAYFLADYPLLLSECPQEVRDYLNRAAVLLETTPDWAIYLLDDPPGPRTADASRDRSHSSATSSASPSTR